MAPRPPKVEEYAILREVLTRPAVLTPDEADVYAFALQEGKVTSSSVKSRFSYRSNKATDVLNDLAAKNLLIPVLREGEGKVRKGQPVPYRAVHPKLALREFMATNEALKLAIDIIDEQFTARADQEDMDEDVWRVPPKLTAEHFSAAVNSARSSVNILSNDCSWALLPGVLDALEAAKKRGVAVTVIAFGVPEALARKIITRGLDLRRATYRHAAFALVDERVVYTHHSVGTQSGCLYTTNPHMVQNYAEQFKGKHGECLKNDGEVARAAPVRQGDERQPEGKAQTSEADVPS